MENEKLVYWKAFANQQDADEWDKCFERMNNYDWVKEEYTHMGNIGHRYRAIPKKSPKESKHE